MNYPNNLETITLNKNGTLTHTNGWFILENANHYSFPSSLLPIIPKTHVVKNQYSSGKFTVQSSHNHPNYLMRAMLKEVTIDVPQEIVTTAERDTIIIPAHKKTVLSWDFNAKEEEYKRFVFIFTPDYSVTFSKYFHVLLDSEVKDLYLSGKYLRMILVSVPNNGKILLNNNQFYISPVNFDF